MKTMDKLMDYLIIQYGYDEPIFSEELRQKLNDINPNTLRQYLKRLVDNQKIYRYQHGIYFIPNPDSILKKKTLSVNKIINKKYLFEDDKINGYISGISFANSLQLTTQNPGIVEIVTNKETNAKRTVTFKKRKVAIRKPRVAVNESNFKLLQILDLLNNFEKVSTKPMEEAIDKMKEYLKGVNINKDLLDQCLSNYPSKTKIKFWESELYDEITL